jgi:hypothetical protein
MNLRPPIASKLARIGTVAQKLPIGHLIGHDVTADSVRATCPELSASLSTSGPNCFARLELYTIIFQYNSRQYAIVCMCDIHVLLRCTNA